jgi:hypothetical protein
MCILCKEWIIDKLTLEELTAATTELLNTAKSEEEFDHLVERIEELEEMLSEN